MTSFDPEWVARNMRPFKGWDDPRPTSQCLHCRGTGKADESNECGFCFEDDGPACRNCDKPISHGTYCSKTCEGMDRFPSNSSL